VRGRLSDGTAQALLGFWADRGALSADEAQLRLPQVVSVLRREGAVVGTSSVYPADLELIGGRRLWVMRSLLDPEVADQLPAVIRATFEALEREFDPRSDQPIGLCVLLAGPAERRRYPEAEWSDPRMIYVGYLGDGRQVRVAYFEGATIARG
jgi:hypothetical protein